MEKTDARKLGKDVQQEFRNQIVRLRKQGRTNREIARTVGVMRFRAGDTPGVDSN